MALIKLKLGSPEKVEKPKPAAEKPVKQYNFQKADRPLNEFEEEAVAKAVKYPLYKYPKIKPVQGTLGYTFRNLAGGNEAVAEFLKNAGRASHHQVKFIKNFIILWKNMDEASRNRVDIFDVLCESWEFNKAKFFGVVQEGMFNHESAMRQVSLSGYTDEFVELVKRMASKEKNSKDRDLLAEMLNLKKDQAPLVSFQDNSTKNELHVHAEKASVPSFISSIKKGDEGVRREVSVERLMPRQEVKQLEEGNTEYIDAEIITETKEKILIEQSEEDFEWEMKRITRDMGGLR